MSESNGEEYAKVKTKEQSQKYKHQEQDKTNRHPIMYRLTCDSMVTKGWL